MASLADLIEQYIQSLVQEGEGMAEIQRALIAEHFRCAPSQVSYVIASRFPPERGYITESRRGGGGFIRLTRVSLDEGTIREVLRDSGSYLSQEEAYDYLERLREEGHLDDRTFEVMKAALSRNVLTLILPDRDLIRANLFKAMLNAYFSSADKEE
jgi:transcriptional regulator CtsR